MKDCVFICVGVCVCVCVCVCAAVNRSLTSIQDQLSSSVQFSADSALKEGIATIAHTKVPTLLLCSSHINFLYFTNTIFSFTHTSWSPSPHTPTITSWSPTLLFHINFMLNCLFNFTLLLQGLPEAVGAAVAGSIRSNIQGMYDEVFRTVVLPAFERSSQEMFRQVDDTFRRGISECESLSHTHTHTSLLSLSPSPPPSLSDMAQLQQQFHQLSEPALQHLATSYHSLHSLLTSPDSPLISSLQREVRAAMQRSASE